jgi:hypothetical protein
MLMLDEYLTGREVSALGKGIKGLPIRQSNGMILRITPKKQLGKDLLNWSIVSSNLPGILTRGDS